MNSPKDMIIPLRKQMLALQNNEGKKLAGIYDLLNSLGDTVEEFSTSWAGGWGREDVDVYRDPNDETRGFRLSPQNFYDKIAKSRKVKVDKLETEISEALSAYKKFQRHVVTELSVIRDKEAFKNENELLDAIENFKWGIEATDIVRYRTPNQIPVYDMNVLNRGLVAPPHIAVAAYLGSLTSKSFCVRDFTEQVTRLLRQLELKLNMGSVTEDFQYYRQFLQEAFDNFHTVYKQLRNRHAKRQGIEIIDEYDVQDLIHGILKLHFKDVREEEYTPSYAGGSSRVDFLLKNEQVVIEIKKTRERLADKEIGE